MTGLTATTAVRVTTRRRAVTSSGGDGEREGAAAAGVGGGDLREAARCRAKSCFSSATGIEPAPLTEPVIVSPVPQIGRIVDGVIATPVGALRRREGAVGAARDAGGAGRDGAEVVPRARLQAADRGGRRRRSSRPRRSPARASRCRRRSTCRTRSAPSSPARAGSRPRSASRRARSRRSAARLEIDGAEAGALVRSVRSAPRDTRRRRWWRRAGSGRSCSSVRPESVARTSTAVDPEPASCCGVVSP